MTELPPAARDAAGTAVLATALREIDEVHRGLVDVVLAGGGLRELCEHTVRTVGGAVAVVDRSRRVVAVAGAAAEVERLRRGPWERGGDIAVVPMAGGSGGGILAHVDGAGARAPGTAAILERAAAVAALTMNRLDAVNEVESRFRAVFLRDVLAGRGGPPQAVAGHAADLGWELAFPAVVLVAEADPASGLEDLAAAPRREAEDRFRETWRRLVARTAPGAPSACLRDEIVVVLPAGPVGHDDAALRSLVRQVRSDRNGFSWSFSVGVSRTAGDLGDLPDAYRQARRALAVGRWMHGPGSDTWYDGLGVFRLLFSAGSAELASFAADTLGSLAEPGGDGDDLLATLDTLLETGLNVAETARRLHFHYNTVRHRVARLERLLGPFTGDAHLRTRVQVAVYALRLAERPR